MLLLSKDLCFDVDKNISAEIIQSIIPSFLIIQNSDLEDAFKMKQFFAKKFLKTLTNEDKEKLQYTLIDTLYKYQIDKIYKEEKATNITDDIAYSYYLANKEKYFLPEQVDLKVLIFKDKKEADTFDQNSSKFETNQFLNLSIENLLPEISLAILNLNPNEISKTILSNDHYIRASYTNKRKSHYASFEEVKESIKNTLLEKKQNEIIEKIYKDRK